MSAAAGPNGLAGVGVVAIGRNEGDRLRRCLASLQEVHVPVVYVDSGSTDGSVPLARGLGAEVVELDSSRPFGAGRARNEGFRRCLEHCSDLRAVMFVDGDCEVVTGWLSQALAELDARPELAVVCGRRREAHPERSVYNRLADLEWDTPVGLAGACGGDALFRVADFRAVGGFDESAKAGEEPELCQRLRESGRLVARIDAEMTRHDLAMTRFGQWWRRQFRVGYHGSDIERRFAPAPGPNGQRPPSLFGATLRRAWVWGLGWPLAVLGASVVIGLRAGMIGVGLTLAAGFAVLGLQAARLAWRVRHRVTRRSDALAYGALMVVDKWANLAGQIRYRLDRARGRTARLIEYKGGGSALATTSTPTPTPSRVAG